MADVNWIKLNVNIFDDEKIKLIDSLPENDAIFRIWIYLLSLAGKTNDMGLVYLSNHIPYTDEMIANLCNRPVNTVRLALDTFSKFGMIEVFENNTISISNWEKHQNIDGLEKIKEQNRLRAKRFYDKNKKSNVSLTLSNATDKNRKDKNRKDNNIYSPVSEAKTKDTLPFAEIIDYLNSKANTKYRVSSAKTKTLIKARFKERFTLEDFKKVIDTKVSEWLNDSKMNQYLRPETLFGTKFESYLNQQDKQKNSKQENTAYDDLDLPF